MVCGKASNMKTNMVRHSLVHTGEKPYPCRLCTAAFSVSSNRARHERICRLRGLKSV